MSNGQKALGKFRGRVDANLDPMGIGRLLVSVPDVMGVGISSWAMPCVPFAGPNMGFFALPMVGAGVWVEFEQGDPDYPIWVGCFWGSAAEVPVVVNTAPSPTPAATIQTPGKNVVQVADALGPLGLGGVTLQSATGATISVNDTGIIIDNAKGARITLTGPTVDVNLGALTVT